MPFPRPADIAEMQKDSSLNVMQQPGLNIGYLSFNAMKPPFDKKEVRQALTMAIDKAAIIKDVYLGAGQPAKNLIPPTMWAYNDAVVDYPFDPAKAQAMLKAAGVTTPLDIDLWYMPVQRPYNPDAKRIAEMMQSDLAKVGVNAKLVTYEWGEYRKRIQNGEATTALFGWTWGQWRSRQLLLLPRLPRRQAGGEQCRQVVLQGVRRRSREGTPDRRSRRPDEDLPGHADDRARRGAGDEHRPFRRVRTRSAARSWTSR